MFSLRYTNVGFLLDRFREKEKKRKKKERMKVSKSCCLIKILVFLLRSFDQLFIFNRILSFDFFPPHFTVCARITFRDG